MDSNEIIQFLDGNVWDALLVVLGAIILQFSIRIIIDKVVNRILSNNSMHRGIDKIKRKQTLSAMFKTASAVVIWLIAIVIILLQFEVNLAGLATGAGLLGVVIGFGAQSSIKDILSGIFMIAENQFRLGDVVSIYADDKDVAGIVEDITIRVTRIRDLDGNAYIVPNGSISIITNMTFHYANVNVDIDVAYETDVDKAEEVINKVGESLVDDEEWDKKIKEPIKFLRVDSFANSSVRIKCLGKVAPGEQWAVAGEFRRRLKKAFEKNNIEIPFDQIVVRQHEQPKQPKTP